jgi:hypothetical protein
MPLLSRPSIWSALLALTLPIPALAAQVEINPGDDVEAAIAALQPGDELILHGGTYTVTERFAISIAGTEALPIVIRAADDEVPVIERPDASENIVDVDFADWVEIRGITFTGGSAGVRLTMVSNFTFADNEIHGTNDVALRANDGGVTYTNLHIVHNHIHDTNNTGEGMYLGCNNDDCRLADSVIERNWVHHTNQATVSQGDGIELKEGGSGVVIRDNVIHDTNYPCILSYSAVGNGPPNVIEGNVMWNCGDHAIQSAADAIIRNNIILSNVAHGIAMQPHQSGAPANLQVLHNTIVIPGGNAINVSGAVGAVTIANNAVFAMGGSAINIGGDTSMITVAGNLGMGGFSGGDGNGYADADVASAFVDGHFGGAPPIDVFPAAGGPLVGAGDPTYASEMDFNHLPYGDPPDVGAYAFDRAGNPGWIIVEGFKEFPDEPGGDDTGGGTGDSGGADGVDDTAGDDTGRDVDGNASASADGPGDGVTAGGSASADDGPTGGGATEDGSAGENDETGGGCGCRQGDRERSAAWMIAVLGLAALRRREVPA